MRINKHISTLKATLKMLEMDNKLLQDAKGSAVSSSMFAADVQVSQCLKDYNARLSFIANDSIVTSLKFEKNIKLAHLKMELDTLGSLNETFGRKILLGKSIQSKKQVNVKMSGDFRLYVTGFVVIN